MTDQTVYKDLFLRVYSKAGCPSCERVKASLDTVGIPYHFVVLNDEERKAFYKERGFQDLEARVPKSYIVPNAESRIIEEIFVGNEEATLKFIAALPELN